MTARIDALVHLAVVAALVAGVASTVPWAAAEQESGDAATQHILIERERTPPPRADIAKPSEWYTRSITTKIAERWVSMLSDTGGRTVRVVVEITRDGRVHTEVQRTSGDPAFDAAAVRAVDDAAPFPPLPSDHPAERARFTIEFR